MAPLLVIGPPALYSAMQNYEQLEPLNFVYLFSSETNGETPRFKQARLRHKYALHCNGQCTCLFLSGDL